MSSRPGPDERDTARHRARPRLDKHGGHAYVAKLVAPAELRHFIQAHGPGEEAMMWVAGRQLDLISTVQLHLAGIGRGAIESRHSRGLLRPMYRGVHLVGHSVPVPGAWELGAVLACGEEAFVSHRSAAAMWSLMPAPAVTEVTVIGRNCRSRDRLSVHRVSSLDPRDRTQRFGIPMTTASRALIEVAPAATGVELERALAEARVQQLATDAQLERALDRAGNLAGVARIRALLAGEETPAITRSEAERRMLGLIRAADLPMPLVNARIANFEVDFYWPAQKVVVEVDGYRFHGHRSAFEGDRRKGLVLAGVGINVIRITWRQLSEEQLWLAAQLGAALAKGS